MKREDWEESWGWGQTRRGEKGAAQEVLFCLYNFKFEIIRCNFHEPLVVPSSLYRDFARFLASASTLHQYLLLHAATLKESRLTFVTNGTSHSTIIRIGNLWFSHFLLFVLLLSVFLT